MIEYFRQGILAIQIVLLDQLKPAFLDRTAHTHLRIWLLRVFFCTLFSSMQTARALAFALGSVIEGGSSSDTWVECGRPNANWSLRFFPGTASTSLQPWISSSQLSATPSTPPTLCRILVAPVLRRGRGYPPLLVASWTPNRRGSNGLLRPRVNGRG